MRKERKVIPFLFQSVAKIVVMVVLWIVLPFFHAQAKHTFADNSCLSQGEWVKIAVAATSENSIYQITLAELQSWGFSDIDKVKIHGYGGAILPEDFSQEFLDDLPEVPVFRDKKRGVILFYAQGITKWTYNAGYDEFEQTNNPYSMKGYYFVTQNNDPALTLKEQVLGTGGESTDLFDDYLRYEVDGYNIGKTGRRFFGEDFRFNTLQNFTLFLPLTNGKSTVRAEFAARATNQTPVRLRVNDSLVQTQTMPKEGNSYERAKQVVLKSRIELKEGENIFAIHYGATGHSIARLDYIRVNMRRPLSMGNQMIVFRNKEARTKLLRYNITLPDTKNLLIWDVTKPSSPQNINYQVSSQGVSFTPSEIGMKEYVAFRSNLSYPSVQFVGKVSNQNLHGLSATDMVIITHPALLSQAERLAQFRRQNDGLHVTVVTPEPIYNEFSSGTPDATAYRRFMKMFYDRHKAEGKNPKYLLLMGDATYDNRLISNEWKNVSYPLLLSYQSVSSYDERSSFTSDDYFGFLDDDEGKKLYLDNVDVGIGRIPARSLSQAKDVVDKIIAYTQNKIKGTWKNQLCFVADDGDGNDHMSKANALAELVESENGEFMTNRVYIDSFKKEFSASGESSPDTKNKIQDLLNSGVMMVNYSGHGSTTSWAAENILTLSQTQKMTNSKWPLFITATCDFSRVDDISQSAGEELLLNPRGGAIALFSTTRVVYSSPNFNLNTWFIRHLFDKQADGKRYRLGDIMRLTKRSIAYPDSNKLSFTLLGDPALTLLYPEYRIRLTHVNDVPIGDGMIQTIKAMQRVKMRGEVLTPSGELATAFDGIIQPTVFDTKERLTTLDNNESGYPFSYNDRTKVIYVGKDSVQGGAFEFQFTVPREINYADLSGMVNLYAYDKNGNEAQGYSTSFLVGGTDTDAGLDKVGPIIHSLYLNKPGFKNGDPVNQSPTLIAEVSDSSGINISGNGFGHDITLIVAGKQYVLNDYYEPIAGQFGRGRIVFPIPTMDVGERQLVFKVWDVLNNSTQAVIDCQVRSDIKPQIYQLFATENPAKVSTRFYLKHDRPNAGIKFRIAIYNLNGIELWSSSESGQSNGNQTFPISWNLVDHKGNRLSPGVYLFRAYISTEGDQVEATETQKIVILSE